MPLNTAGLPCPCAHVEWGKKLEWTASGLARRLPETAAGRLRAPKHIMTRANASEDLSHAACDSDN